VSIMSATQPPIWKAESKYVTDRTEENIRVISPIKTGGKGVKVSPVKKQKVVVKSASKININ
jgi:hypothetical protein